MINKRDVEIPHYLETTDMLKIWLENRFFDGLYSDDCACAIGDLCACGEGYLSCHPGFLVACDCGDHDYHIISMWEFKSIIDSLTADLSSVTKQLDDAQKEKVQLIGYLDRSTEAICSTCNVDCEQAIEFEREPCWGKELRDIIDKAGYKNE